MKLKFNFLFLFSLTKFLKTLKVLTQMLTIDTNCHFFLTFWAFLLKVLTLIDQKFSSKADYWLFFGKNFPQKSGTR
jgi:small-conductance mechanosensitive channel